MAETPAVNPKETGSAEVQKRVADAGRKLEIPVIDNVTGKKICHVFFTPVVLQVPRQKPLSKPGVIDVDVQTHVSNIMCLGAACHQWNDAKKECRDITFKKSMERIADTLDAIDGHNRLHTTEG